MKEESELDRLDRIELIFKYSHKRNDLILVANPRGPPTPRPSVDLFPDGPSWEAGNQTADFTTNILYISISLLSKYTKKFNS